MPRRLPAVRRPVPLQLLSAAAGRAVFSGHFANRPVHVCGSGTQALAAAIIDATTRRGLEAAEAEVIVPAYGCPDLVAACTFANVYPRLVDTAPDAWGYDQEQLRNALGPRTAAIVAVDFLGLGDDAASVIAEARSAGIPIIQDSAQFVSIHDDFEWPGDYVVVSFGRGKPINLMGGGALIGELAVREPLFQQPSLTARVRRRLQHSTFAALLFNAVTHPSAYALAARMPGLGVGATVFHSLRKIESWQDDRMWCRVGAGLAAYLEDRNTGLDAWQRILPELGQYGVLRLQGQRSNRTSDRLLRFPVLVAPEVRDRLVDTLAAQGATSMYRRILPQIDGIPPCVKEQGPFPNAQRLAQRLVTLPTHPFVTVADVDRVLEAVREYCGDLAH